MKKSKTSLISFFDPGLIFLMLAFIGWAIFTQTYATYNIFSSSESLYIGYGLILAAKSLTILHIFFLACQLIHNCSDDWVNLINKRMKLGKLPPPARFRPHGGGE